VDPAALLKQARNSALISQAELGRRAGIARSAVADYERGRFSPTVRQLDRLLAAAGLRLVSRLEPLGAELDTAIRRCLARPVDERMLELPFHLGWLLRVLDGVPYRMEGATAALLQGAPVPVSVVEVSVANTEPALDRLTELIRACGYLRLWDDENRRWQLAEPTAALVRDRGPVTRWWVLFGEARLRLVHPDELSRAVYVEVDQVQVPVIGLWQLETADERAASVLARTRQLLGAVDVGG